MDRSSLDLYHFQSSLEAFYSLDSRKEKGLTTNTKATRLYSKNSIQGRFFHLLLWLKKEDEKVLYLQCCTKLLNKAKQIFSDLERLYTEFKQDPQFQKNRKKITQWSCDFGLERTSNFFLFLHQQLSQKAPKNLLLQDLPKALVLVELDQKEPIPFLCLRKLARKELIYDETELIEWIQAVSKNISIDYQMLINALNYLFKDSLAQIEWQLMRRGLTHFSKADPLQIEWQKSLIPGALIEGENNSYCLKKELISKDQSNLHKVFETTDQKIFITGINPSQMRIERVCLEKIGMAYTTCLEKNQRFFLFEKETGSLETDCFIYKNRELFKPFFHWLKELIQKEKMPKDLKPSSYLWSDTKGVVLFKPVGEMPFAFDQIERFIFSISHGSFEFYQYFLQAIHLIDSSYFRFYQALLASVLQETKEPISALIKRHRLQGKIDIERAKSYSDQLKLIVSRIEKRICAYYEIDKTLLKQLIQERLHTVLEERLFLFIDQKALENEVGESVIAFKRFKMKEPFFQEIIKNYPKKDRSLMRSLGVFDYQQIQKALLL